MIYMGLETVLEAKEANNATNDVKLRYFVKSHLHRCTSYNIGTVAECKFHGIKTQKTEGYSYDVESFENRMLFVVFKVAKLAWGKALVHHVFYMTDGNKRAVDVELKA